MARDKIKPDSFWECILPDYRQQIEQYETLLEQTTSEQKNQRIRRMLFHKHFCYVLALYSAGASMEQIKVAYATCLKNMSVIWSPTSSYVDMLWMISMGVLFDAHDDQVDLLIKVYSAYDRRDSLISFLLNSLSSKIDICDDVLFKDPYQLLSPITRTKNPSESRENIHEYLKVWYKKHNDTWWYNTHKSDVFVGYWCFEAAALVKILKFDAEEYINYPHYPQFNDI